MDVLKAVTDVVIYVPLVQLHMLVMKLGGHRQMVKLVIMILAVAAVVETVNGIVYYFYVKRGVESNELD
jgi:Tfp pilus assembly protein PilO